MYTVEFFGKSTLQKFQQQKNVHKLFRILFCAFRIVVQFIIFGYYISIVEKICC